jgi:alpha-mannosidase II
MNNDVCPFQYGSKTNGDKSGAYLFMPDGEAKVIKVQSPLVRIIEGKVLSYVEVHTPFTKHTVILNSSPGNKHKIPQDYDVYSFYKKVYRLFETS